jgi:hypothetical protein
MDRSMLRLSPALALIALTFAGCSGTMPSWNQPEPATVPVAPSGPAPRPSLAAEDIVGRWGIASFHRPEDQARTEAAAQNGCSQPYVINRGSAGVAMLGHDSPTVTDMVIKASVDGKTYVGPGPDAGGSDDREIVSFNGRVLVLKWVDPEVGDRYGTMVLVRCPASSAPRTAKKHN